jgi:hypothetical protein
MQIIVDLSKDSTEQINFAVGMLNTYLANLEAAQQRALLIKPADLPGTGEPPARDVFSRTDEAAAVFGGASAAPMAPMPPPPAPALAVWPQFETPAAPMAPPPVAAAVAELDKYGLPWDARIHASTKGKNVTGEWRGKRGVDAALVAQVTAEWRAMGFKEPQAAHAPTSTPPAPGVMPVPPATGAAGVANSPAPGTVIMPPSPAVTATIAYPSNPTTFPELLQAVTYFMAKQCLNHPMIEAALQPLNVASLPMLAMKPEMVPQAWAAIKVLIPADQL